LSSRVDQSHCVNFPVSVWEITCSSRDAVDHTIMPACITRSRLTAEELEERSQPAATFTEYPVIPVIDGEMQQHLQAVAARGKRLGNREDVFAKVGDSITSPWSESFFPLGHPNYQPVASGLANYPDLLATWAVYRRPAGPFGESSFSRISSSAFPGYTSFDAARLAGQELLTLRPAISLIMIGTNDAVHINQGVYEANLRQLLVTHLNLGVIPVLSTIPPLTLQGGAFQSWVATANQTIVNLAEEYQVPVWNYWSALVGLPMQGLSDHVHPTTSPLGGGYFGPGGLAFGYNVRNFTALQALTKIRQIVFEDRLPDGFALPPLQAWNPLQPGQSIIATGAMPGAAPVVSLRDVQTGAVSHSFLAYEATFRGGVQVAVADMNGDSVLDIITAAGPGGGPVVKAFSGSDGRELFSLFAFEPDFTGGVSIAVADLDHDGVQELIIGAGPGGGPRVRILEPFSGVVRQDFYAFEESFRGGVQVACGYFGPTIGTAIAVTPGPGGGGVVALFAAPDIHLITLLPVFADDYRGGVNVTVGDLTGDQSDELILGTATERAQVRILDLSQNRVLRETILSDSVRTGVRLSVVNNRILANVRRDPHGLIAILDMTSRRIGSWNDPHDPFTPYGVWLGGARSSRD